MGQSARRRVQSLKPQTVFRSSVTCWSGKDEVFFVVEADFGYGRRRVEAQENGECRMPNAESVGGEVAICDLERRHLTQRTSLPQELLTTGSDISESNDGGGLKTESTAPEFPLASLRCLR